MKKFTKATILGIALIALNATNAHAQSTWSQCQDGRTIVRCETYDCPQGDTNGDGKCTLTDTGARLTDARNDSFCANPISGCGQVHYFPTGTTEACVVRAEVATQLNCDLYAVANPTFTPQPTASPRATTTPRPTASASATPTTKGGVGGGDSELPKTGPEHIWIGGAILLLGAAGVYLYEKHKLV